MDTAGNLYGTTRNGGVPDGGGFGTVFKLQPTASGPWTETVLHTFMENGDGGGPECSLVFDQKGNLYGTSTFGTVFELSPTGEGWTFNVIYTFGSGGSKDGSDPQAGLVFDTTGDLYGTTSMGGQTGNGTVFELTPNAGSWTEAILYNFAGGNDGAQPMANLILDSAGNLYGTTYYGGGKGTCANGEASCGTVFKLTRGQSGQWAESLFRFPKSGASGNWPAATLLFSGGSVYGTTTRGGVYKQYNKAGALFEITP
jgi:uncharacterized repeat protein (TIGR03803 family)